MTHWAGLANSFWWRDREKKFAAIVCTLFLPLADVQVLQLWAGIGAELYRVIG